LNDDEDFLNEMSAREINIERDKEIEELQQISTHMHSLQEALYLYMIHAFLHGVFIYTIVNVSIESK